MLFMEITVLCRRCPSTKMIAWALIAFDAAVVRLNGVLDRAMNKKKRAEAAQFDRQRRQRRIVALLIGLLLLAAAWVAVLLWTESSSPESVKERFAQHLRKTSDKWENINWIECDPKKGVYELTVGFKSDVFHLVISLAEDPNSVIFIHDQTIDNPPYATMRLEHNKLKLKAETKIEGNKELRIGTRCAVIYEAFLYAIGKPVVPDNLHPVVVVQSRGLAAPVVFGAHSLPSSRSSAQHPRTWPPV